MLLVKPPERSAFDFGAFSLAVLAASVRRLADVAVIDASDLDPQAAAERVWARRPDVVGVTVMGHGSVDAAARFVRALTGGEGRGDAQVLAGGHGATAVPEVLLDAGASAIVAGEGERTLAAILEGGFRPGLPGTICKVGGELCAGPPRPPVTPLDDLPHPARELIPPPRDGVHLMETSRGCPHRCAFCETTRFFGTRWRAHSPARVAEEVRRLVDAWQAWTILIADDNFAASPARVLEIAERIERGPMPATFAASIRADDLLRDERVVPAMARARILRVTVGVETLEPAAASAAGKPIPLDAYREAFARLRAHGIFSVASFIAGLPGEGAPPEAAVRLAVEAGPDAAIFVPFVPMPGTPLAHGRPVLEPRERDVRRARALTAAFFRDPEVVRRLEAAEAAGGVRGMMARMTKARRAAGAGDRGGDDDARDPS